MLSTRATRMIANLVATPVAGDPVGRRLLADYASVATNSWVDPYDEFDRQRLVVEPPKGAALPGTGAEHRTDFARDRARVLHCAALRRLADKTQVVGPRQSDTPRTRLTHSLRWRRSAGGWRSGWAATPTSSTWPGWRTTSAIPRTGTTGSGRSNEVSDAYGGFEGNAQNFRILTRLEPKVLDPQERSAGLNLTRAALDAVTKYPWYRTPGRSKFGFYSDDTAAADWMRERSPRVPAVPGGPGDGLGRRRRLLGPRRRGRSGVGADRHAGACRRRRRRRTGPARPVERDGRRHVRR